MTVRFFNTINSFLADLPDSSDSRRATRADDFTGYQTFNDAKKNIWRGRDGITERSAALLDKIEGETIELKTPSWQSDLVGFIPSVPAYVAGAPDSMLRPIDQPSDTSPIRIFASVCVSGGLDEEQLEKRGIALLALCRKLQAIRPVELYVYADMEGDKEDHTGNCAIPVIKLETSPLDLTTAGYIMSDPGFLRQLCFTWGEKHGFEGKWAWRGQPSEYQKRLREVLNASPNDLVIRGGYLQDPLITEPVEWLNEQVRKYADTLDCEYEETKSVTTSSESKSESNSSNTSEFQPGDKVRIEGCRKGRTEDRSKYNSRTGEVQRKVVAYFRGKASTKYRVKFQDGTNADFIPNTIRKV